MSKDNNLKILLIFLITFMSAAGRFTTSNRRNLAAPTDGECKTISDAAAALDPDTNKVNYVQDDGTVADVGAAMVTTTTKTDQTEKCCDFDSNKFVKYSPDLNSENAVTEFVCESSPSPCLYKSSEVEGVFFRMFTKNKFTASYVDFDKVCLPTCPVTVFKPVSGDRTNSNKTHYIFQMVNGLPNCVVCNGTNFDATTCGLSDADSVDKKVKLGDYTGNGNGLFEVCKNLGMIAEVNITNAIVEITTNNAANHSKLHKCVHKGADHIPISMKYKKLYTNAQIGSSVDDDYFVNKTELNVSVVVTNLPNVNTLISTNLAPIFPMIAKANISGTNAPTSMTFCNAEGDILRKSDAATLDLTLANGEDFETDMMAQLNTGICSDNAQDKDIGCVGDKIYVINAINYYRLVANKYNELPNFCVSDLANFNQIAQLLSGTSPDGTFNPKVKLVNKYLGSDPDTFFAITADMSEEWGICPTTEPFEDGDSPNTCVPFVRCSMKGTTDVKYTTIIDGVTPFTGKRCYHNKICNASTGSGVKMMKIQLALDSTDYFVCAHDLASGSCSNTDEAKYKLQCSSTNYTPGTVSQIKYCHIISKLKSEFTDFGNAHTDCNSTTDDAEEFAMEIYLGGSLITKCKQIGMFRDMRTDAGDACATDTMCGLAAGDNTSNQSSVAGKTQTIGDEDYCFATCANLTNAYIKVSFDGSQAAGSKISITCGIGFSTLDKTLYYKLIGAHKTSTTFKEPGKTAVTLVSVFPEIAVNSDVYIFKYYSNDTTIKLKVYGATPDIEIDATGATGTGSGTDAKKLLLENNQFDVLNSSITTASACHLKTATNDDNTNPYTTASVSDDANVLICSQCTGYKSANLSSGDKFLLMSYNENGNDQAKTSIECASYVSVTHGTLKKITIANATVTGVSTDNNILKTLKDVADARYKDEFTVFIAGSGTRCADVSTSLFTDHPSFNKGDLCIFKANCIAENTKKYYEPASGLHKCYEKCREHQIDVQNTLTSNTPITIGTYSDSFECVVCDTSANGVIIRSSSELDADANYSAPNDFVSASEDDKYCVSSIPLGPTPPTDVTTKYTVFVNGLLSENNRDECWALNNPNITSSKSNSSLFYVEPAIPGCVTSCKTSARIIAFTNTIAPWNLYCTSSCTNGFPLKIGDIMPYSLADLNLDVAKPASGAVTDYVDNNVQSIVAKSFNDFLGKDGVGLTNDPNDQFCYFSFKTNTDEIDFTFVQCPGDLLKFYDQTNNNYQCLTMEQCRDKHAVNGGTDGSTKVFYKKATFSKDVQYTGTNATGAFTADGNVTKTLTYSMCVEKCSAFVNNADITGYASKLAVRLDSDGVADSNNSMTGMYALYNENSNSLQECFPNVQKANNSALVNHTHNCFFLTDAANQKPLYDGTNQIDDGDSWCFPDKFNFCPTDKKFDNSNQSTVYSDFCVDHCPYSSAKATFANGKVCVEHCSASDIGKIPSISQTGGSPPLKLECIADKAACKALSSGTKYKIFFTGAFLDTHATALIEADDDTTSTGINGKLLIKTITDAAKIKNSSSNYEDTCITTNLIDADIADPSSLNIPLLGSTMLKIDKDSKFIEFLANTGTDVCQSTGLSPTEHLYIVSNTLSYCLTTATCDALSGVMAKEKVGINSHCVDEKACLRKLEINEDDPNNKLIKVLPRKKGTGSTAQCVTACNQSDPNFYSAIPSSFTTLASCLSTDNAKFNTCSLSNTDSNGCLELIYFSSIITLTVGSNDYFYDDTNFSEQDYFLNAGGVCTPPNKAKYKALAFNGNKKANICKASCSQESSASEMKKLTFAGIDPSAPKTTCAATCNTGGSNTIKFIKGITALGGTEFVDLECVGDQNEDNKITENMTCIDKDTISNHIITSTDTKFKKMVERAAFLPTGFTATTIFCFEAKIDGSRCADSKYYLEDSSFIHANSTKKAYMCVDDGAACSPSATQLVMVNTLDIGSAGNKVCANSCADHQAAVTGATQSYVLSETTGTTLQTEQTVGVRECITDKEMNDNSQNEHFFIFSSLKPDSTGNAEAGITDTTIISANKLVIKVPNTVTNCPTFAKFRKVIKAGKVFECVASCPAEKPYEFQAAHVTNPNPNPVECLTATECYAKDFEGTGTDQKIFKTFDDDNSTKKCVSECPATTTGGLATFPSFKFTRGTGLNPSVIEIGPCLVKTFNADYPMLNIFTDSGFEAKGATVRKGPGGAEIAAANQETAVITHADSYKGQFTDNTKKLGCINNSTQVYRLFTQGKDDTGAKFKSNIGYPCINIANCALSFEETDLDTNYTLTDEDLKIPFLSEDEKACLNTCDSTATIPQFVYLEIKTDSGNEGKHNISKKLKCMNKVASTKKVITLTAAQMEGFFFYEGTTGIVAETKFKIASAETSAFNTANIKFGILESEINTPPKCPKVTNEKNYTFEATNGDLSCENSAGCIENVAILNPGSKYICSASATTNCVPTDFENNFKVAKFSTALGHFQCVDFTANFSDTNLAANKYFIDYLVIDRNAGNTTSPTTSPTIQGITGTPVFGTNKLPGGADQNKQFNSTNTKLIFLFEADSAFDYENTKEITDTTPLNKFLKLNDKIPTRGGIFLCNYFSTSKYKYYKKIKADGTAFEEFCNEITDDDKNNLLKLEVTITDNKLSLPELVNTPGKEIYLDHAACADLNNNPIGSAFRIYEKADGSKVCSDQVYDSNTIRRVNNLFYAKSLITGTDYAKCVANNKNTVGSDCVDFLTVLNTDIPADVNSDDPFTVNDKYQVEIANLRGTNFLEEKGKFLKIIGNANTSSYEVKANCNTSNTILMPDLMLERKMLHVCVFKNSATEEKHYFKINNTELYQLEKLDDADSYILAEDAPFLREYGRSKLTSNTIEKKLYYSNKMFAPHGIGADDAAQLATVEIEVAAALASGSQKIYMDKTNVNNITATNTQYIIQTFDNSNKNENYKLIDSSSLPTECNNLYVITMSDFSPKACIQLWTTRTKFSGVIETQSAFKIPNLNNPLELTVEARTGSEIVEATTGIKFTDTTAAIAAGLSLDYENNRGFRYGCSDPKTITIRAIHNGQIIEICGSETEITDATAAKIFNNYINRIGDSTLVSTDYNTAAKILAKTMLVIGKSTTLATKTYYFNKNEDFSRIPLNKEFFGLTNYTKLPDSLENLPEVSAPSGSGRVNVPKGGFYVHASHCTSNNFAITGASNLYSLICLENLSADEQKQFDIVLDSIPDTPTGGTLSYKVNDSGCTRMGGFIDFTVSTGARQCHFVTSDLTNTDYHMGYKFPASYCTNNLSDTKAVFIREKVAITETTTEVQYICRMMVTKVVLPMMLLEEVNETHVIQKYIAITQDECLAMADHSFTKIGNYWVCRKRSKCLNEEGKLVPVKDTANKIVAYNCLQKVGANEVSCTTGTFDRVVFPAPPASDTTTPRTVTQNVSDTPVNLVMLDNSKYCIETCPDDFVHISKVDGATAANPAALVVEECYQISKATNASLSDLMTVTKAGDLKLDIFQTGINFESTDATHKTHVVIDQPPGKTKKIHLVTATDCAKITDFVVKSVGSQGGNDRSGTAVTGKTVNYCISKIQCMNLTTDAGNNYIDAANKTCISSTSNLCYKQTDEDNPIVNLKGGLKEKVDISVGGTACHNTAVTDVNPCGATHSKFSNDGTLNYHATNAANKLFFCIKNNECRKVPGYIEHNGHCTLLANTTCTNIVKNDMGELECVGSLTTNYGTRTVDSKTVNYTFRACALEHKWIARDGDTIGQCVDDFAAAMSVTNMKYCIMSQGQCNSDINKLELDKYKGSFVKHATNNVFVGYPPIKNSKMLDKTLFKYEHATDQRFYATIPEILELNNSSPVELFIDFKTLTVIHSTLGTCTAPFFGSTIPAGNILSYGATINFCLDRDSCYNSGGGSTNKFGDWSLFYYNTPNNDGPKCGISCAAIDGLITAPTGDKTFLLMNGTADQNKTCIKRSECRDKGLYINMRKKGSTKEFEDFECNMQCSTYIFHEPCTDGSSHTGIKACTTPSGKVEETKKCFPNDLTLNEDTIYRLVETDAACTDPANSVARVEHCMTESGNNKCLSDLSKPLCPNVFFEKSNRQKIDETACDEQPSGTTANTDPKMPSFENEKNICYRLNECTADQYIYIDYTANTTTGEGKGTTQLKCGDFCIRRHVFVNSTAITGLATQKFCVDDCHDLERLKDLHISGLQVEDFETQFNTNKMIGECEAVSCPSGSMLATTNEEYKYCSTNYTTINDICGYFLGNMPNLAVSPKTCLDRSVCKCTLATCTHMFNPNLNTCTTRQKCLDDKKRLSLTDNGELVCLETPQATPATAGAKDHNLFINGSHFECNRYGDGSATPYVWVQPDSASQDQDSECITREKCIKDKRFLTLDGRCVTEAQCIGTETAQGQLGFKLLFGEADSQYCVTDLQCGTFKRDDSTSLVPRPTSYLVENSHPTCFNCFATEFYIPSIYFTKPTGTCAQRCVGNPDTSACETTCNSSTDYVPSFNCVTACPSGFWQRNSDKVCQPFCSNFLDETQKICQDSCQSRHVKKATTDHYICLNDRSCGTLLKMDSTVTYKSSSLCVTECPVFYRKSTTNMCISCSTLFYNDQCNPAIPDGLVETKDTTVADSCSTCTTLKKCVEIDARKKYYYKGKCYNSTGLNLADKVLLNDEFNTVVDCGYKDQTGIDPETQTCVTKCPSENQGFFNGVCKSCIKEGENFGCYIEGKVFKASANCPVGMTRNPDKPFFCITEAEAAQKQAAECKGLTVFDKEKSECVPCNETGTQVIVNEQCVNDCGIKKKKVLKANNPSGKNICEDCPAYSDSNNCIEKCPGEQIINTEGKCEPCPAQDEQGNELKFVNGECKKICSATDASNCIAETDAQEGATCTGCIDCNGQTATLTNGTYKCVCLGELKGKNCRTSPQTAEATVAKNAEELTKTISLDLPLTTETKTQAQTMIETTFENSTATISAENADIVERGLNTAGEKLEAVASTITTTDFTSSEEELNNSAALADTIINGINNYNKTNETANRLSSLNGNRILQSTTVQLSLIFQSVLAKAKAAIRTWVNAYANKPTLNIALATLNFSSFKAHFFPLSKDRETKISAIKRLEQLNIPVVEVDACVDSVMSQEGVYPIIAVVIFNQNITNLNNSKSYETFVFSSQTRKQVDCSAFTNSIQVESESIPKLSRIKSKILEVKKSNKVDLLDRNSGFYEDRCQKYSLNGFIFTPKMKRNILYPKLKVECSEGCKFVGMTDSYKALCQCFNQNKTVLKTEDDEMDASNSTADYPGEIVKCNLWLDSVNDWYRNYALYLLAGIMFFIITLFTIKIIQDEVSQMNSNKYKIFKDKNEFLSIGATNEGHTKLKVEDRDNSREHDRDSKGHMISRVESKNGDGESEMMDNKSENSISIKKSVEITACQLDHHSPFEVLEHDNRNFITYLVHVLSTQNVILAPFLAYSLIKPFFVRVYDLMVYLLLVPFFVTVFTWDEHIEAIYDNKGESAFGQTFSQFKFGWDRVIYGILATFIVRLVLHKIVTPSDKVLLQLSRGFAGAGETVVNEYNQYKRNIAVRLGFYFFFATTLSLVAIYYCLAYIDFYTELNSNWLIAVSVAIGAGVIFQALLQLLHVCVWAIAKRVNFLKYAFAFTRFLAI